MLAAINSLFAKNHFLGGMRFSERSVLRSLSRTWIVCLQRQGEGFLLSHCPPKCSAFHTGSGWERFRVVYTEKRWAPSVALRPPSFISTLLMPLGCCRNAFSRALGPPSVVLTPRVMAQAGGSNAGCSCSVTLQCKIWITIQSVNF